MKEYTRNYRWNELGELLLIAGVTLVLTALIGASTLVVMVGTRKPVSGALERLDRNVATPEDMEALQNAGRDFERIAKIAVAGGELVGSSGPIPDSVPTGVPTKLLHGPVPEPAEFFIGLFQDVVERTSRPPQTKDNPIPPLDRAGVIKGSKDKFKDMNRVYNEVLERMRISAHEYNSLLEKGTGAIRGGKDVPVESQARSAQSAARDIELTQGQAINRVKQQIKDLSRLRQRINDLRNTYYSNRGRVINEWFQSWDSARQDWDRIIRDMARPQPGVSGSSGTSQPPWGTSSDHPHDAEGRDLGAGKGNLGPTYDN